MSYAYPPDSTVTSAVNSPGERDIDYFAQDSLPSKVPLPRSPTPVAQQPSPSPPAPSHPERNIMTSSMDFDGSPGPVGYTTGTDGADDHSDTRRALGSSAEASREPLGPKENNVFDDDSDERLGTTREHHEKSAKMTGDTLGEKTANIQAAEQEERQRKEKEKDGSKFPAMTFDKDDAADMMNMDASDHVLFSSEDRSSDASPGVVITDPKLLDSISSAGTSDKEVSVEEKGSGVFSTDTPLQGQHVLSSPISEKGYFGASLVTVSDGVQSSPHVPATPSPSEVSVPRTRSSGKQVSFSHPDALVPDTASYKRVSFDDTSSTQLETPFTKTLNHLKRFRGKENSPSKARRNASLPEEIAELAKEASETEGDSDLDKYRDEDLAPMDPVMQAGVAGDLIMPTTPSPQVARVRESAEKSPIDYATSTPSRFGSVSPSALKDRAPPTPTSEEVILETTSSGKSVRYELEIPGHYGEPNKLKVATAGSADQIADFIRIKAEELDATPEDIEKAVKSFYKCPGSFVVDEGETKDDFVDAEDVKKGMKQEEEHPTFVKIIGMLPMAMVSAVAQPAARYTDQAFNSVMQKLGLLSLDENKENQ